MYIASYKQILSDSSLDNLIASLSSGIRADIPYGDAQTYSLARITCVVVKGDAVEVSDNVYTGGEDTVDLIMELENSIRAVLEPNYDSTIGNGAGIVAALVSQ